MASGIESFSTVPIQTQLQAYAYQEYADDEYVQAFVSAYNRISQGYLDWSNQNPLALYTKSNISGEMLDFVGNNLYGISRPVISTFSRTISGELGSNVLGDHTMGTLVITESGTAIVANDDIYKRTLTWYLYRGDGVQMSVEWIRRRIARFLYGVDGSDIDVGLISNVSITFPPFPIDSVTGQLGTNVLGTHPLGVLYFNKLHQATITVPSLTVSNTFYDLFLSGYLSTPFQMAFTIQIA